MSDIDSIRTELLIYKDTIAAFQSEIAMLRKNSIRWNRLSEKKPTEENRSYLVIEKSYNCIYHVTYSFVLEEFIPISSSRYFSSDDVVAWADITEDRYRLIDECTREI